jgi:transcriptional regulator GlxA family with amidase domain
MSQRLSIIQEWQALAHQAQFRAHELADICQVSLRTLQRHFRQNYGLTVSKWLRDIRLRQAYNHLLHGSTVKEVAYSLGVSPSYLLGDPKITEFPSADFIPSTPVPAIQALAV